MPASGTIWPSSGYIINYIRPNMYFVLEEDAHSRCVGFRYLQNHAAYYVDATLTLI